MMAIAPPRLTMWVQRPTKRTQLAVRQILEVDTEGELDFWPQRFEACVLSILWTYVIRSLDCIVNFLKR